ncbi:MAG: bifunctional riboflavin kinase/FAD synthetase [Chloroflexota bacterium]|nr:bifunctional riboflavin kinase/FAD synthetase [Chloroflexota bacterium]
MAQINPDDILEIVRFSDLKPYPFKNSFITIGNFDGVHLGHQAIIHHMLQESKPKASPIIVVTFFPNPSDYFNPNTENQYLSTPSEKSAKLLELGVDFVITFEFNREFANLSPTSFINGLMDNLGLGVLVVGPDFALGKDRHGIGSVLQAIGRDQSFSIETVQPVIVNDQDVSSTKIRYFLDEGNVVCAANLLGRNYTITGTVVHGSDRGLKLGLPTTNLLCWPRKKKPAVGVYATRVMYNGRVFQGITNVGYRPTFEVQSLPNIESHILDFDGNIYGEKLTLAFIDKIRDERKFDSVNAFLAQIDRDKAVARKIFNHDETSPNLPLKP